MIIVRAIAAESELAIGFCKKTLVTQGTLRAENPIIRTGAKRKIVPVDPALRRARNFYFVKFFLQPTGITRRKF